jgi:hypothetical protein
MAAYVALVEAEHLTDLVRQRVLVHVDAGRVADGIEMAFLAARRERAWPSMTRFEILGIAREGDALVSLEERSFLLASEQQGGAPLAAPAEMTGKLYARIVHALIRVSEGRPDPSEATALLLELGEYEEEPEA